MDVAAYSLHGLPRSVSCAHLARPSKMQSNSLHTHGNHQFLLMPMRAPFQTPWKLSVSARHDVLQQEDFASRMEYLELMKEGMLRDQPDIQKILQVAELDVKTLIAAASEVRDRGIYSRIVSFSPKVFIPLTRACRDACAYCTFALTPQPDQKIYMSVDEVLDIARQGMAVGCTEALFTLGDKPELLHPRAKEELATLGHTTTVSYVAEVAKIVLEQTGLLPHLNTGVMSRSEIALLRHVSVSQGLMLETVSERLLKPGKAHFRCPDKVPTARLSAISSAGAERVPFTSGLLVGIGETREERIWSLLELHKLHKEHGHIQELIIQNFCAKRGTPMEHAIEPSLEELQWTIAMARLVFGPSMNIQAPPNLTPRDGRNNGDEWIALIEAGINDWGGISPVTKDWVNPEAPWPQLSYLAAATAKAGKMLVPRLAIYPHFVQDSSNWLDPHMTNWVLKNANSLGFARGEDWSPGINFSKEPFGELLSISSHVITTPLAAASEHSSKKRSCSEASSSVGIDGSIFTPHVNPSKAFSNVALHNLLEQVWAGMTLKEV